MLPGVELTAKLALIPILNVSLLCRSWVHGNLSLELLSALIFLSTCRLRRRRAFPAVKNVPARRRAFPQLFLISFRVPGANTAIFFPNTSREIS